MRKTETSDRTNSSSDSQNKLVVFDVEGVVIPKGKFLLFDVVGQKNLKSFLEATSVGVFYEAGLMPLKRALESLYILLKGFALNQFLVVFENVPLLPGVEETFCELRKSGIKTALISSGIPRIALENLGQRLGVDFVSGLEVGVSDGVLTGEIWGDVIEPDGKAVALKQIIEGNKLSSYYLVGVADDRNNLSMFKLCDLKIGYNPDFVLSRKSDAAVRGELTSIIPVIKYGVLSSPNHNLPRNTCIREAIHIGSFLISLVCMHFLNRYFVAFLLLLLTILYTSSELMRMLGTHVPFFTDITKSAARKSEYQEFVSSPLFFALGIMLSLMFFPEPTCYVSITVLTLGDGFASVFGQTFGNKQIPYNKIKYVEGTISGFTFAFLGSTLFVHPFKALIASAVGMFIESLPLPLNDNLAIPLSSGLALAICSSIF
ncbi:MAG: haloacid dehalogenase-like hydrolase [Candidatus Bathyarchaeia archaeon]